MLSRTPSTGSFSQRCRGDSMVSRRRAPGPTPRTNRSRPAGCRHDPAAVRRDGPAAARRASGRRHRPPGPRRVPPRAPGRLHRRRPGRRAGRLGDLRRRAAAARHRRARSARRTASTASSSAGPTRTAIAVMTPIVEVLHAPSEPARLAALLAAPSTHVVTLTVTEKGYPRTPTAGCPPTIPTWPPTSPAGQPRTALGQLARGLTHRAAAGEAGPLTVLSCDNLPRNGAVLERLVREFADRAGGDDRRALPVHDGRPRRPRHHARRPRGGGGRARARRPRRGRRRAVPPVGDRGRLRRPAARLGARRGGARRRTPGRYEERKLRLLNGVHSLLAYAGLLAGAVTVADAWTRPGGPRSGRAARGRRPRPHAARPRHRRLSRARSTRAGRTRACCTGSTRSPRTARRSCRPGSRRPPRARLADGEPPRWIASTLAAWARHLETGDVRDPGAARVREALARADGTAQRAAAVLDPFRRSARGVGAAARSRRRLARPPRRRRRRRARVAAGTRRMPHPPNGPLTRAPRAARLAPDAARRTGPAIPSTQAPERCPRRVLPSGSTRRACSSTSTCSRPTSRRWPPSSARREIALRPHVEDAQRLRGGAPPDRGGRARRDRGHARHGRGARTGRDRRRLRRERGVGGARQGRAAARAARRLRASPSAATASTARSRSARRSPARAGRCGSLIEIDSGDHRAGVSPDRVAALARGAARAGLDVIGAFTHGGHGYARPGAADGAAMDEVLALAHAARELDEAGFEPEVLSAGSTPTVLRSARPPVERGAAGHVRVQRPPAARARRRRAGAARAVRGGDRGQHRGPRAGRARRGRQDARPRPPGLARGLRRAARAPAGDRRAGLRLPRASSTSRWARPSPRLGDVVAVVPNHACAVADLSDELLAVRDGAVAERWPVDLRARS